MIDTNVLVNGIALLSKHFDRTLTPEVVTIWSEYLNAQLTTEEFQQAVKTVILENRFFPTAKELVEAVKGDPELQALQEWELCVSAARNANMGLVDSLSPMGKFALQSLGGVSRLGRMEEDDLRWIKKEFVVTWKAASKLVDSRALPPATIEA